MARTAVKVDPEHYIPVPRYRLQDALLATAGERREPLATLSRLLQGVLRFEYQALTEQLKRDYFPFDPAGGDERLAGMSEEAIAAAGEKRGVGCEEGEFEVTGEIDQESVASFFAADMVPGEGEVEVFWAEGVAKPDSGFEEVGFCGIRERFRGQEGNQTFGLRAESGREGNFGSGFCALRR